MIFPAKLSTLLTLIIICLPQIIPSAENGLAPETRLPSIYSSSLQREKTKLTIAEFYAPTPDVSSVVSGKIGRGGGGGGGGVRGSFINHVSPMLLEFYDRYLVLLAVGKGSSSSNFV